ncbi:2-hydroxyacyl-CoA dehydratase family protein [Naasia aerilata]|uniref:Benzoyl-CoA reductase/2-hydroxyglutaryl-CoA dehydratase subunit, BcrC/BadD/HgdB n=1 Tax=Naasia aerilata TaxID=1162966 RepID=A0ABM8GCT1_9MICO|nr:2-hydroxyacyl-CoA dehydratase family protein [Naasia aerilata]BDZ46052.1 hypothetical protein GCM10025866_19610 [Naasia aerilata]
MTDDLARAYAGLCSAAEAAAAAGRPVIGIVGRDVPAMLITAAGAQPFRLSLAGEESDEAWAILGRAVDRAAAVVLTAVLSGSLDFLRALLLTHDSEASVRLFYTLQELHRRGRIRIPVHLVDQVHLDRPSTLRYNVTQLSALWDRLEEWTGAGITTGSLEASLAEHARVRRVLAGLRAARRAPAAVSGVTMLHSYAVAAGQAPAETVALLTAARPTASPERRLELFVTGSAPIGDSVYRILEGTGAVVVGEDHDWGDPILSDLLPERIRPDRDGVLEDLALSRLRGAPASASSSMAARAQATGEGIRASGARALLSIVRSHDEAPLWDWRHQKAHAGVPAVQVRGAEAGDPAALAAAVESLRAAS